MPGVPVAWSTSNPAIAAVQPNGLVTGAGAGAALIRASVEGYIGSAAVVVEGSGSNVYPVPPGIDATGVRDVTPELLDFFAAVPDGGTIAFPAGARYRIEGTLRLRDRNGLTFEGNGAEFFATEARPEGYAAGGTYPWRTRSHWHVIGGSNLTFRNVVVRGAHPDGGTSSGAYVPSLEAQHGFDVWGVNGLVLDRVRVTDVYGDFVYLSNRRDNALWSSNVHIRDSHFERNGRQGIAFAGTRDVLIERSYIGHVRRASLDFEPYAASAGVSGVTVRDNTFGPGRLLFIAAASSAEAPVRDITVAGNLLEGRALNSIIRAPAARGDPTRTRYANFRLINNRSEWGYGSPEALIKIEGVDGVQVLGNHQPLDPLRSMTGVYVDWSCWVVVANNTFPGAAREFHIHTTPPECS
jgi:hypothetical protein